MRREAFVGGVFRRFRNSGQRRRGGRSAERPVARIEALEHRRLLASGSSWNSDASGDWSDGSKWANGLPPGGAGQYANFNVSISADRTVNLDVPATILNLSFADTAPANTWTIADKGQVLTLKSSVLSPTTPTIQIADTTATLQPIIAGTEGFTVTNTGTTAQLTLQGANTYSGVTTIGDGTKALTALVANNGALGASGSANKTVVANGSRVQLYGGITTPESFDIVGTGTSGVLNNASGSNVITGAVKLTGNAQIGGGAGSGNLLTLSGGIDNGGNLLTVSGAGDFRVDTAAISGAGGLAKSGSGTLTLAGANGYGGVTTVTGGTLAIQHGSALGSTASGVSLTGGTIALSGGIAIGAEALTLNGVGSGNVGALRNVSGNNSWAGTVTLGSQTQINSDAGTLTIDVASGNAITASNQNVIFGGSGAIVVADPIATGSGTLEKRDGGSLTLAGANTYSGGTTVSGGKLVGTTTSLQGAITNNATVTFEQSVSGTYAGIMSGTGSLEKLGSGTVTLSGANTYAGGTTVSAGTLVGTSTSLQGAITNNAAVTFDQASSGTYAGTMAGTGSLVKAGAGTLTLTGAHGYAGATKVDAGTLLVNGNQSAAVGAVTVSSGATLGGSGTLGGSVTASGILSPGGSGTIQSLASGALTLQAGSSFVFDAVDATTVGADLMVVDGGLAFGGAATLDLSGANLGGAGWAYGTKLTLISYTGASVTSGFSGYADDTIYTFGSNAWQFNYNDSSAGGNYASEAGGTRFVTLTLLEPQAITFDPFGTRTYGDAPFPVPASASSGLTLSFVSSDPTVASISGGTLTILRAGTTTITASQAGNDRYAPAVDAARVLTVSRKSLSITADAKSKTYGDADPSLTYVASGLVGADAISGALARAAGENVGGYAIGQGTLDAGSNYSISFTGSSLTISQKSLTVTGLAAANKTYDGTTSVSVTGTPSLVGKVGADTVSLAGTAVWSFPSANAGSASLVRTGDFSLANDAAGNYTLLQPSLSATIAPRAVAVGGVTAINRTYDAGTKVAVSTAVATLGAVTGVAASGVVAGDAAGLSIDGSGASGAIPDKKVGTKTVTVTGVALAGSASGNYVIGAVNSPSVTIAKAELTVAGIVAADKPYDGTNAAKFDLTKAVFSGVFSGDVVSPAATGTLAGTNVGGPYAVTATASASGADAGNYSVVTALAGLTASVVPKQLTITGLTATSRVYDGTTNATIGGTAKYVGLATVDATKYATPVLSGTRTASFADKKAGTAKPVTVSGYVAPSSNYTLAPVTLTATISKKTLTTSGVAAIDKPYDGTSAAKFDLTGAVLSGVIDGDVVTSAATGTLAGTNVGGPYAVTAAMTSAGADGGNYTITAPTGLTASVVPKQLTITGLTAASRVYDGTTNVTITGTAKYLGLAAVDATKYATPTLSGTRSAAFVDKNVGTAKPVPVDGYVAPSANYTLAPLVLAANVTAKALTVSGATAVNRTYDGTKVVAISGGTLAGILAGEIVSPVPTTAVGTMADKKAGVGKAVTVSGYSLSGADAGNYLVTQPIGLTVTIAQKALAVTGISANSRAYDGTTVGTASGTAAPDPAALAVGDVVSVGGTAKFAFADANVGTAKAVAASGYTLSGTDAANYLVQQPSGLSADISPKGLTISGLIATSRVYDGTANVAITGTAKYVGLATVDATKFATPTLSGTRTAAFADKNIGTAKPVPVNGYVAPSANYTLAPLVLAANVTPKVLTVTGAVASGRVYDGTTAIKVSGGALATGGVIGGEAVALETAAAAGTVADRFVGVGKVVTVTGYSLSGTDSGNYSVTQPTTLKATITAKPIAVTGLTGVDREYDATSVALVSGTAALDAAAIVAGDDLSLVTSAAKFAFATSAVGTAKAIAASGFSLGGTDAANYAIVQPAGLKATVTQATITVTGPTLVLTQDPISGTVVIPVLSATISGLKGADTVTGAATVTTTATATSPKGLYAVKVGLGTLKSSTNYKFAFVDGSITIQ